VGGRDASGMTADLATSLIQGPDGTQVTLTIKRDASTFDVTITRAEIRVPSVRSTNDRRSRPVRAHLQLRLTTFDDFASLLSTKPRVLQEHGSSTFGTNPGGSWTRPTA